jgi:integrase
MQRPLTDVLIRTAQAPSGGRVELRDVACRGLALRITANDVRTWTFRFTSPLGRGGRVAIGRYPDVSLGAARKRADELRREVASGASPTAAKRQARAEAGSKTFQFLADRYLREHSWRHKRSAGLDERNMKKHLLPHWGKRPYASITRADVIEVIESLIAQGHGPLANRVQALISGVFSFALDAGLTTTHPAIRLRKRGIQPLCDRVLDDDELRLFWAKIVEPPVARGTGFAFRLQLLTATRPGEIAGLRRAELLDLDGPDAAILLPGERTKNGLAHWVPLSPLARETIAQAIAIAPNSQFVFPSRMVADTAITGHALSNGMRRFGEELDGAATGVKTWKAEPPTPHDLRRTCRTRLSALGVPREHCDAILNHSPQDVGSRHYDRHTYRVEKRAGLDLWGRALGAILESTPPGGNVVPLPRRHTR